MAKILIMPIAFFYALVSNSIPRIYSESEIGVRVFMHVVEEQIFEVQLWFTLGQFLLIMAPYLVDEKPIFRVLAIAIYLVSCAIPTLYLYSYVVDGVHRATLNPYVFVSPVIVGVAATILYVVALAVPRKPAALEHGEQNA